MCGRGEIAAASMVGISRLANGGGHSLPYLAMLCEALWDITIVVPATLLGLLSPLLESHGDLKARQGVVVY